MTTALAPQARHPRRTAGHPHRVGNALRAVKVFATAVLSVAVLGEYAEEAGVHRR